jgi:hypothetical protein
MCANQEQYYTAAPIRSKITKKLRQSGARLQKTAPIRRKITKLRQSGIR